MQSSLHKNRIIVREFLSELKNKEVLYFPNPGNAGDALIGVGVLHALDNLGIRWRPITTDVSVDGQVVLLGGGGNLVPLYDDVRKALERFAPKAKRLIILPHTIRGLESILNSLQSNVTVLCRDPVSYLHVLQNTASTVEVALTHDMAFHIDVDRLLKAHPETTTFRTRFEAKLREANVNLQSGRIRELARYGRHDAEKGPSMGPSDIDISQTFAFGTWPGSGAELSAWCLLEAIRMVEAVETDRLHVGIGSSLIGRKCTLHDNSYGKNNNVYNHSLRNFSNIKFVG